jgi:hypothetical protein
MQIGQGIVMIADPQEDSLSILVQTWYHGVQENNPQFLDQALERSIRPWQMLPQNLFGYNHYLMNFVWHDPKLHDYGVITLVQHIYLLILFFMPGPNISR